MKTANKEKIRVAVYESLMWFTFSKKLYVLVYKKLFMLQLHLSYALLFYYPPIYAQVYHVISFRDTSKLKFMHFH